jgi:antagonist of KipI
MKSITIESPGFFSTIQDLGRFGYQKYGIPPSGAMDEFAFQTANILVGNERNAAGIEITFGNFIAQLNGTFEIAITGGDAEISLNYEKIKSWSTVYVKNGDILKIGKIRKGCRVYLGVSGGISVPKIFGSRSTYTRLKMGGFRGRKLQKGDILEIGESSIFSISSTDVDPSILSLVYSRKKARTILGPENKMFSKKIIERFFSSPYQITTQSDRMGYRLKGASLKSTKASHDIISNGIVTGAIQVPTDGQPIIMMVEHQTVGGYAKIATVISSDIPLLAQMKAGDEVEFENTTFSSAQKANIQMQDILRYLENESRKKHLGRVYLVETHKKNYRIKIFPKH